MITCSLGHDAIILYYITERISLLQDAGLYDRPWRQTLQTTFKSHREIPARRQQTAILRKYNVFDFSSMLIENVRNLFIKVFAVQFTDSHRTWGNIQPDRHEFIDASGTAAWQIHIWNVCKK